MRGDKAIISAMVILLSQSPFYASETNSGNSSGNGIKQGDAAFESCGKNSEKGCRKEIKKGATPGKSGKKEIKKNKDAVQK